MASRRILRFGMGNIENEQQVALKKRHSCKCITIRFLLLMEPGRTEDACARRWPDFDIQHRTHADFRLDKPGENGDRQCPWNG